MRAFRAFRALRANRARFARMSWRRFMRRVLLVVFRGCSSRVSRVACSGVKQKRCSCAPATYQRALHHILAHCPITASSIRFCLLCCQPEPFPRLLNCQGITACAMKTLQTICLIGVSHRHAMQDLVSSGTLHHPDLEEAIGGLTLPAIMSKISLVCHCVLGRDVNG